VALKWTLWGVLPALPYGDYGPVMHQIATLRTSLDTHWERRRVSSKAMTHWKVFFPKLLSKVFRKKTFQRVMTFT